MARATRITLDLALVSLRTMRPVISKVWSATKTKIISTTAKPLVYNPVVMKVESILDHLVDILVSKLTVIRNHQLIKELKYLEKEVEKVKKKISKCATSKIFNQKLAIIWRYAKIELAPPMTINFLQGPAGQKLEKITSNAAESFMTSLGNKIKEIDAEEERAKQEKEAILKKAIEKAKAEETKKQMEKIKKIAKQSEAPKKEVVKKSEPLQKEIKKNPKSK